MSNESGNSNLHKALAQHWQRTASVLKQFGSPLEEPQQNEKPFLTSYRWSAWSRGKTFVGERIADEFSVAHTTEEAYFVVLTRVAVIAKVTGQSFDPFNIIIRIQTKP